MYKEMLDVLLEDLNDPTGAKQTILKNQLSHDFANKNKENRGFLMTCNYVVRSILNHLTINELIGIQPVTPTNLKIVSSGIEWDIFTVTRPLSTCWTLEALEDIRSMNGLDIEAELRSALAIEIEHEITAEIINKIDQVASYSGSKNIIFESFEDITKCIIEEVREVDGNWIIISPTILAMLQSSKDATYKQTDGVRLGFSAGSITNAGVIDENIKVYVNTYGDEGTVLIGSKVENREDTPIVYAPETMLMPVKRDANGEEVFGAVWNFMTRSALFVEPVAADAIYKKLVIKI